MANRYLFAGADPGIMRVTGGTIGASGSGNHNTTYCDHSLSIATGPKAYADFIDSAGASDFVDSTEDLWVRFDWTYNNGTSSANYVFAVVDGSDQPWLAIRSTTIGSGVYGLYYNSGTGGSPVWTLIGSTWTRNSALSEYDLRLRIGSPHDVELYIDNVLTVEGTFTQASFTEAHAVFFQSPSNNQYISQIIVTAGIVTIGSNVFYGLPTGAGASSAWTGLFSAIDDSGASAINDTDLITSSTNGQRSTFTYSNLPTLPSGYTIGDVFLYTRARNNGVAPVNVKPVRRSSAPADIVGSNFSGIGAGFGEFLTRYSGLDSTEYNASEFGVEAAT